MGFDAKLRTMKSILVRLPTNRWNTGTLYVYGDKHDLILAPMAARGKADGKKAARKGNPARDPTLPYGDTPAGTYKPGRVVMFAEKHERLGAGWIEIEGESGDAAQALANGRSGIAIHAGAGNDAAHLRATYGCIRVTDIDFRHLAFVLGHDLVQVTVEDVN